MSKLDEIVKTVNKTYKENIMAKGIERIAAKRIPFSSPRANYMLYGGLPRGRLIEFAGEESGGKTTTALDIVANAQYLFKQEFDEEFTALNNKENRNKTEELRLQYLKSRGPKQVVYADCENTLDEEWATLLGVSIPDLYILKPQSQTAEQIFEMLLSMIETDELGLIVIDSLGVMLSAQAYEKTMEQKTYGGIASSLTLFSRKAELLCNKYDCTLIGINQVREDMNSPYGGVITTGGRGWKHNCSVRIMFQKGAFVDKKGNELKRSSESPAGNIVNMNIIKTKVCRPDRRVGCYTLKYETGVDKISDLVDLAIKYNIIVQAGSWFSIINENGEILQDDDEDIKLQGKSSLIEYLQEHEEIQVYLKNQVDQYIED